MKDLCLYLGASGISSYVSQLVNHCLHVCKFPDTMKLADVSSLYKKNDNLKKDNYRPVSVLPSLSKIYERVMGQQLSDFFDKIFSALLSSFRKRYSCQSTLLNMTEHFQKSLDNGEYVSCLSMDLSKAFDCLPHCLTICKLHSYGVAREACTSFSVFKIHACHRDEGSVILAGFFAGFTGLCLSTTSSMSGGWSHVGMTTFSFQWITTEFLYEIAYILIP